MKARNNPTDQELMRRLRRRPESLRDPRVKNDAYWALRLNGYPHSYAKRALRDQPPIVRERTVSADTSECDPQDLLFPDGYTWTQTEVALRPLLSDETICTLEPRASEYTTWDEAVPGFGVRVRPSGYKSFVFYWRARGSAKLHKYTIGNAATLSLDQARQAARAYRNAVRIDGESEHKLNRLRLGRLPRVTPND